MVKKPLLPQTNTSGLFTRTEALAAGWTDRDLRRNPEIYRVIHGVYAHLGARLTHRLKCEAVSMCFPPDAVITGRSAATLLGVELAGPHTPVEVVVNGNRYVNRRYGTRCWAVRTYPREHRPWQGIRLATAPRACLDLLSRHPLKIGVPGVDAMLHAGTIDVAAVHRTVSGRSDHRIRHARRALELVDGRAESIPESVLRLVLRFGGLQPEPQVEVRDADGFVARVDLAFEEAKLAVEYDGAWHGAPSQMWADERRRERLRQNGWRVIVVTQTRLHTEPESVVEEVKTALGERRR
ncbi:endonuclease domain-containing protein [Bounagaea algeriensis]